MAYFLYNAAMVPNEGTFTYHTITRDQGVDWLWEHHAYPQIYERSCGAQSFIGYPQTVEHMKEMLYDALNGHGETTGDWMEITITLNRAKSFMKPGDQALVCRLAYRVENAASKGQLQTGDWEYGILIRHDVNTYHCETCANSMGEQCTVPPNEGITEAQISAGARTVAKMLGIRISHIFAEVTK